MDTSKEPLKALLGYNVTLAPSIRVLMVPLETCIRPLRSCFLSRGSEKFNSMVWSLPCMATMEDKTN